MLSHLQHPYGGCVQHIDYQHIINVIHLRVNDPFSGAAFVAVRSVVRPNICDDSLF